MLHGVVLDNEGDTNPGTLSALFTLINLLSLPVAAVALEGNEAALNSWIFIK